MHDSPFPPFYTCKLAPQLTYSLTVPGAPSASPQTHYIFMYLILALFSYVLP